jgi:diguanylate cyclase (GGDEF)-like protein/PAS domain S-box-containing protein
MRFGLPRRYNLLAMTTVTVAASALATSILFVAVVGAVVTDRIGKDWSTHLDGLIDTVESTVSIACFVRDQQLANEVATGLMKNREVLGVVVRTSEGELARIYRAGRAPADGAGIPAGRLARQIRSPFNPGEAIGEIILDPDPDEFARITGEEVSEVAVTLMLQMMVIIAAVVAATVFWIVRPIKELSDALHHMDTGSGKILPLPRRFANSELGRLGDDINAITGQLAAAVADEKALRLQREVDERKYHDIFDNAETGIFVTDREGRLLSWNPALQRLLRLPADGSNDDILLAGFSWREPEKVFRLIGRCLDRGTTCADDLMLAGADGAERWLNVSLSPIGADKLQGVAADVTERKEAEAEAQMRLVIDKLTGIANRAGLEAHLQRHIATHDDDPDQTFVLMFLDIDGFRRINNALGLAKGDQILRVVAMRLRACLKSGDLVARIGGDGFAVVLPRVPDELRAATIAQRIVAILGRDFDVDNAPIRLGASIGMVSYPRDGADVPTLLRNVELALSRARAGGGNRYVVFDSTMADAAATRQALEADMRLALRRDEFRLFLQPIVDLRGNRLAGAEALIRWQHPERGLVAPDAFIPVAEETDLIMDIGRWILEAVCRQLAAWRDEGRDLYISLNVSARQIPDGLPPDRIVDTLTRHGLEPSRLVLEITEGALLADIGGAQLWLKRVRELGLRVYLDDFGTGYSSLSYLKRFPVDTLKVDKSFVRDMAVDGGDRALVEAIVAMAASLGLSVVAEGVEDAAQLNILREIGCGCAQGYYFSRPVPAADFAAAAVGIDDTLRQAVAAASAPG